MKTKMILHLRILKNSEWFLPSEFIKLMTNTYLLEEKRSLILNGAQYI